MLKLFICFFVKGTFSYLSLFYSELYAKGLVVGSLTVDGLNGHELNCRVTYLNISVKIFSFFTRASLSIINNLEIGRE